MRKTRKTNAKGRRRPSKLPALVTKPRLIGLGAALLVLLIAAYGLAAAGTVTAYQHRLASGSFGFSGGFTFQGQDFLSTLNSDMNFSGTYAGGQTPAVSTTFLGTWAGREYSGEARLTENKNPGEAMVPGSELYFNLSGPDMPVIRYRQGSYLLPLQSGVWYSARADESLYDNLCAHTQPASLQGKLALYRTLKSLRITPSPWVNFWARLQDFSATHVSGSLSGDQLAGLWDAVQKASPPGCSDPNTLGITSNDLKHVSAHVDLVSSHDGDLDLLTVTLTDKTLGAKATLSLLTSNYGDRTVVTAPAGATDINALYSRSGLR